MPVIVFVIDNSASMNQTTYFGTSYLDVAKNAIECFLKIRSRDQISGRNDRYMLLTLDEPPSNIKVGWKEHMNVFTNELKNLKATGLTNIGTTLKQAFDLLNMNRLSTGMETYGQGRYPFYLEPSMVVLITDGSLLTSTTSVFDELTLPASTNTPGHELTLEPFRWDQRLFSIILNICAVPYQEQNLNSFIPYANTSPINAMCEVTGGRSYLIASQRMLNQCLESLVSKIQAGVVVNFVSMKSDADNTTTTQWDKCRQMIYVPKTTTKGYSIGHWPIPEDYSVSLNATTLPQRSAHPTIKFKCEPLEPMVIDEIPFDKYELEPSPLTQYILEQRQPNTAWQVFIMNSLKPNESGYPFGYLKASSNLMSVNLFVLPYNYPQLFHLIYEFFHILKLKPTKTWIDKFDSYLKTVPAYYYAPIRRALSKKGLQHLVAENLECCLSIQIQSYLKNIKKQAKILFDQVCAHPTFENDKINLLFNKNADIPLNESKDFQVWLASSIDQQRVDCIKNQFSDFNGFQMIALSKKYKHRLSLKDSYLSRNRLIDNIVKLRPQFSSLVSKSLNVDELHSLSIQDMGNYHDYLKQQAQPLRDVDETTLVRQHMFGNPFKLVSKDQRGLFGTDEIDEVMEESTENLQQKTQQIQIQTSKRPQSPFSKRKGVKGPLSRRISYSRSNSQSSLNSISSNESDTDNDVCILDIDEPEIIQETIKKVEIIEPEINQEQIVLNNNTNKVAESSTEIMSVYKFQYSTEKYDFTSDTEYLQLKASCKREIKKSTKDCLVLLKLLSNSKISVELKKLLTEELIYEAARFRCYGTIQLLTNFSLNLQNNTV